MDRRPLSLLAALLLPLSAGTVPTLQVGAPAGPGDSGSYADYQTSLTNPEEEDTAVTSGSTLYVAGAYGPNTEFIGGQFGSGLDWSYFGFDSVFDDHDAILMATVPDTQLDQFGSDALTIELITDGGSVIAPLIYSTETFKSGFVMPTPPANHDPVKDQAYLFFDVGYFDPLVSIPNFADETLSNSLGEVKTLTFTSDFSWIHFDVFALVTDTLGTRLVTSLDGNPGSHDVTWKGQPVPEPGTLALLGGGIIGLWLSRSRRTSRTVFSAVA